jgi:hypothetical protein
LVSGDLEDIENNVIILMRKLGYQLLQRLVSNQRNNYKGVLDNVKINEQGLVDIYSACDGLGVQVSYLAVKYDIDVDGELVRVIPAELRDARFLDA